MSRVLTARTVETLKAGPVRQEIPDRHMPNLYLVLQPSGHRSWAIRYRVGGRSRKHTIGAYPAIDLKAARELAAKAFRVVAEGRDPGYEKALSRSIQSDSVEAVVELFFERHCKRVNRPRTIEGTRQLLDLHVLPRWRRRLIKDISRRDVIDLLDGIVASGRPISANRTFTTIRKMFNWALERDIIDVSPCAGVRRPTPEVSRDRALSDAELGDVWRAVDKLSRPYATLVKLLALTGQRRDEVARMRWAELDFDARLWSLPAERVKNGRLHIVPLSKPVLDILAALPRLGHFVLTTDGRTASNNFTINKRRLDALLPPDMPPWRMHDLRRTVASGLAKLGVNLPVIEKVLNHVSGSFAGIVGVYQHHDFACEKRAALDAWAAHVMAVVAGG
jgi:integrase